MAILTKGPRGTQDVLPAQSYKWQYLEKKVMEIAGLYWFPGDSVSPPLSIPSCLTGRWEIPLMWCRKKCIPLRIRAAVPLPCGRRVRLDAAQRHRAWTFRRCAAGKSGISAGCVPLRKTPGGPSARISPVWRRDARLSRCGQRCGSDLHGVPHVPGAGD